MSLVSNKNEWTFIQMQAEEPSSVASSLSVRVRPLNIAWREWFVWLPGSVLSFILASVFRSGLSGGLLPNVSYPYTYGGDFLFHSWLAQRATEGWIFENARSGYPFGSALYDFPNSDGGSLLIQKFLGIIFGSYYASLNIYFLLGFFVTFAVTYCVTRSMGLVTSSALVTSALYTFLPFHFIRINHIFYTWYFVVPIYFFLGYTLTFGIVTSERSLFNFPRKIIVFIALAFVGSFGIYYDAFGLVVIGVSLLMGRLQFGNYAKFKMGGLYASAILLGALVNVGPTIVYEYRMGPTQEVAARSPAESEILGLKLIQLFYPRPDHRLRPLRELSNDYKITMPFANENRSSALGVVGSVGLLALAWTIFMACAGKAVDAQLSFLALCALVLFGVGTVGGLGDIFAVFVSPLLRAWNRISVFIAFPAIAAVSFIAQKWIIQTFPTRFAKISLWSAAALLTSIGLLDQSTDACGPCNIETKANFELDRNFVGRIEAILPKDSAVYQLPYMSFPEAPAQYNLVSYSLVSGFINSTSLRWSFAGMKGREGDLFYRALSEEPLSRQVEVIRKLGFRGIYVDGRGYQDHGAYVVKGLSDILGETPSIVRSDEEIVFFQIQPESGIDPTGLTARQIMQSVGYEADRLGHRIPGSFSQGIDFTNSSLPDFLSNAEGLSAREPWGRWSDARLHPTIRFDFATDLPKRFTMILEAQPFGPNADQNNIVRIGSVEQTFKLAAGTSEVRLQFDLGNELVRSVEFYPHASISPLSLGVNGDMRELGLGFVKLRFVE